LKRNVSKQFKSYLYLLLGRWFKVALRIMQSYFQICKKMQAVYSVFLEKCEA